MLDHLATLSRINPKIQAILPIAVTHYHTRFDESRDNFLRNPVHRQKKQMLAVTLPRAEVTET